jgi:hypothetical protein
LSFKVSGVRSENWELEGAVAYGFRVTGFGSRIKEIDRRVERLGLRGMQRSQPFRVGSHIEILIIYKLSSRKFTAYDDLNESY